MSISVGRRGDYSNVGIPGTELSFRNRLDQRKSERGGSISTTFQLNDDGSIQIVDENGQEVTAKIARLAKEQHRDLVQEWLGEQCNKLNSALEAVQTMHLKTPPEYANPTYEARSFDRTRPKKPVPKSAGILGLVLRKKKARVERENATLRRKWKESVAAWENERQNHIDRENQNKRVFAERLLNDVAFMENLLLERIEKIEWPRETHVSLEILRDAQTVYLDVDLPEIEDVPDTLHSVAVQEFKLNTKKLSQAALRKIYINYVHAIGFHLIGQTFACLPGVKRIILSGCCQRADPATGHERDDYLYSVQVSRDEWKQIIPDELEKVDVVECLGSFNIRRSMTKTGIFKPVEPWTHRENSVTGYIHTGNTLYKAGKYKQAITAFTNASNLEPTNKTAVFNRAVAYHAMGDKQSCHAALKDAAELGHKKAIELLRKGSNGLEG